MHPADVPRRFESSRRDLVCLVTTQASKSYAGSSGSDFKLKPIVAPWRIDDASHRDLD